MRLVSVVGVRIVAALAVIAFLSSSGLAQDQKKKKPAKPNSGPANAALMAQLTAQFATWDLNKDLYLDKSELARAFRGPDARSFDYKPKSKTLTKDVDKEETKSTTSTSASTSYDEYSDYQFLKQWDKNADEKLSKDEYDAYAKKYVAEMKPILDAELRVVQAEKRLLQHKPGTKQHRQAEQDLRRERESFQKLSQKVKALDRHVMQALRKQK